MIRITKVIERWIMKGVELNRLQVVLDSLDIVRLITERVTDVVIALNLLWVQIKSLFVAVNGFWDVLEQVLCISQVIINISNFIIKFDCLLIVSDCFFGFTDIIQGVSQTNKCLDLIGVVDKRLLEVLHGSLGMS